MARVIQPLPTGASSRRQKLATHLHRIGALPGLARLRATFVRDLRILAYHRVVTIDDASEFGFDLDLVSASAAQFREQMSLVRERFNPIRFVDLVAAISGRAPLPRNPLIVTFDDGYDDNYRTAFPILRELGVPATFFVSTGHVDSGAPFAYDWLVHIVCHGNAARLRIPELALDGEVPASLAERRQLAAAILDGLKWLDASVQDSIISRLEEESALPRSSGHDDCRPMTWDQLREMQAAGMEIGSHGVSHRMLAKLPHADMRAEVVSSKETLDRELAHPVDIISYPVGGSNSYNDAVVEAVRAAGFMMGCSYTSGRNAIPTGPEFALRRLPVERQMDIAWFDAMLGVPELFSYPSRDRIA